MEAERLQVVDGERRGRARQHPGQLRPERHGTERRVGVLGVVLAVAIEPAVGGQLHAWRARLHVILGVEMAARRIGRAHGVHHGQASIVPPRLQRGQTRMQAKEPVQVDHLAGRHGDGGSLAIVCGIAVRHDHVEPVHGAAHEEAYKNGRVGAGRGR
jgi:hypothetical protein